jgi:hypothetical protein
MKESELELEVLKIEESESELLCTDSTALDLTVHVWGIMIMEHSEWLMKYKFCSSVSLTTEVAA